MSFELSPFALGALLLGALAIGFVGGLLLGIASPPVGLSDDAGVPGAEG